MRSIKNIPAIFSGLITIAKNLDREATDLYRLNISARDHGYPQRVAYMTLEAYIVDVNDNPPIFQHSVYIANVTENQSVKTLVTTIKATDIDIGEFGNVVCSVIVFFIKSISLE